MQRCLLFSLGAWARRPSRWPRLRQSGQRSVQPGERFLHPLRRHCAGVSIGGGRGFEARWTETTELVVLSVLQHLSRAPQQQQTIAHKDTYRDKRWGMRAPASSLVESSTLLLHKALVAVTLQHGLSLGTAALTSAPRTVLKTCLGCVPGLDNSRSGLYTNKNSQKSHLCLRGPLCKAYKLLPVPNMKWRHYDLL